jgi:putative flippase GtrA
LVDKFHLHFYLAQGLVIAFTVIISYIGHASFTFRSKTSHHTEANSGS